MSSQLIRSRVTRYSALVIAVVIGAAILVGTGESALAQNHGDLISGLARVPLEDLPGQEELVGIPPNPVIPPNPITELPNRGAYISAVAIPNEPIVPAP